LGGLWTGTGKGAAALVREKEVARFIRIFKKVRGGKLIKGAGAMVMQGLKWGAQENEGIWWKKEKISIKARRVLNGASKS